MSDTKERAKLRSENAVATNRMNKKGRFNPEMQRMLGLRGGPKGGSRNTLSQQESRSKVGQTHGRATGMGNQSPRLKTILQQNLCWTYKDGVAFETAPAAAAIDIINQLNCFRPGSIKNASTFYKVFHDERKQIYGWTLRKEKPRIINAVLKYNSTMMHKKEDMVIRSEAGEGMKQQILIRFLF